MLFSADITQIMAAVMPSLRRLEELADEDRAVSLGVDAKPVEVLIDAFHNLLDRLRSLEPSATGTTTGDALSPLAAQDFRMLGDYGTELLFQLAHWARRFQLPGEAEELERLSLSLACWIARQGGEIANLAPLVNSAAALANSLHDPQDLEQLFLTLGELQNAVDPAISQDLDRKDPHRPWRILLINRAIVATRSHQPRLMEAAFGSLIEHLPEDAPTFFRNGMGQMDALDYPERVRRVMQRYFDTWCGQTLLH